MADNKVADPGVGGATFATDDIGGVDYPRTKITLGADGVNDGDVSSANPMPVREAQASTANRTSVADNAAAVTILAANAARKAAYVLNTSSAILYLGLGATDPTATDYTEKLVQDQAWRVPECYTGIIKGIWASDPNDGVARVTELV